MDGDLDHVKLQMLEGRIRRLYVLVALPWLLVTFILLSGWRSSGSIDADTVTTKRLLIVSPTGTVVGKFEPGVAGGGSLRLYSANRDDRITLNAGNDFSWLDLLGGQNDNHIFMSAYPSKTTINLVQAKRTANSVVPIEGQVALGLERFAPSLVMKEHGKFFVPSMRPKM